MFADKRFGRYDKRSKLPKWIQSEIEEECVNLSTDMAIGMSKMFFRHMAQGVMEGTGMSMWTEADVEKYINSDTS